MPTRFRDLSNTNFGTLNSNKNKNIIRYNASTNAFETVTIDTLLGFSTNPPDILVNILEENIDTQNITLNSVDGGSF